MASTSSRATFAAPLRDVADGAPSKAVFLKIGATPGQPQYDARSQRFGRATSSRPQVRKTVEPIRRRDSAPPTGPRGGAFREKNLGVGGRARSVGPPRRSAERILDLSRSR